MLKWSTSEGVVNVCFSVPTPPLNSQLPKEKRQAIKRLLEGKYRGLAP